MAIYGSFLHRDAKALEPSWQKLCAAIQRSVQSTQYEERSATRNALLAILHTPQNEQTVEQFLSLVEGHVPLITQVIQEDLRAYLANPITPPELLVPDISNADRDVVSPHQQAHAAIRYRYARRLMLLGLSASLTEAQEQGRQITPGAEHILPGDVRLYAHPDTGAATALLLNPSHWERLETIKDRVQRVWVGGKSYILKERKTRFHSDTKKDGHVESNSAATEFAIGRDLYEHASVERDGVHIEQEKPLGYVTFPNGHQFVLFEDGGALRRSPDLWTLTQRILAHPEHFQAEYEAIRDRASVLRTSDDVLRAIPLPKLQLSVWESLRRNIVAWWQTQTTGTTAIDISPDTVEPPLTFEEFAAAKASWMGTRAELLSIELTARRGLNTSDNDGIAYRSIGDAPELHAFCFDTEYHFPTPHASEDFDAIVVNLRDTLHSTGSILIDPRNGSEWKNGMCLAAIFAFMERDYPRAFLSPRERLLLSM